MRPFAHDEQRQKAEREPRHHNLQRRERAQQHLVETNVVPQTSTLNAPNKCPCILRFSCMIFSFSAKTGGYGLTSSSCPANALYGAGLK